MTPAASCGLLYPQLCWIIRLANFNALRFRNWSFTNKGFKMKYFLCVLGMVFIIEGLPYFIFPERLKIYLLKMTAIPDSTLRFLGISAMIVGLILLYFGRS
jgi:hypothetical protein